MNRKLFGALVVMALALAINANAQSKARADIPFDFVVGEKALPAATYDVSEVAMNTLIIRATQHSDAAIVQYQSARELREQSPKLVFHKVGDRYFLYQVWNGDSSGMQLRESKLEKEQEMASKQGSAPQEVVVALR